MTDIHVRKAKLGDTRAISKLFQARIEAWQRLNERGQVEDLPYEDLSIYERWLHGGAWMSVETGAIFLNHVLRAGGMAVVAVQDNHVTGYAEAYPGNEPHPYGQHLHIAHLVTLSDLAETTKDTLIRHLLNVAQENGHQRLTVSFSGYDSGSAAFYQRYGMERIERVGRYTSPAQTGQGFYKAVPHPDSNPAQIEGWHMTIGRLESARQHWETLWPSLWEAVDEIAARQTHRLRVSASGQEAFVCCQQQLYDLRSADIYCWSPKPLTAQLLTAIRDWSHRQGYRTLVFSVPESVVKLLGPDTESHPYQQDIYAVDI